MMFSDDEDVFVMSAESLEDTKVILKSQALLQKDINDLKSSVASIANHALQERTTSDESHSLPDVDYEEVKNTVHYLVQEAALTADATKEETMNTSSSDKLVVVPTLKTAAEMKLKEYLVRYSKLSATLTGLVDKITLLETNWSLVDSKVDSLITSLNDLEQYGRLYN